MFNVGDKVVAKGNYRDEQLGQFAPTSVQTITEVKAVHSPYVPSGQWVKTDIENDWIDSAWFEAAQHGAQRTGDEPCVNCGQPYSEHKGRGKFCKNRPTVYASR